MAPRAQLDGRVALVTGGGRGIGRAIARELAELVPFLVTRRGLAVIDQVVLRRATVTPWS